MTVDRIKMLREAKHMSQVDLAKKLGLTRSSVNAWELGISVPSTQYITELSALFQVSTDYLLCQDRTETFDVAGLTEKDKEAIYRMISHLRSRNEDKNKVEK